MYSKSSRIVVIVFAVLVVSFFIIKTYSRLGGSEPLNISLRNGSSYLIHGKEFKGRYNSTEMETLFYQMREMALSDSIGGTFCIVSDLNPEVTDGKTVSYFVGFILDKELESAGELLQRRFDFESALKIELNMHNSVMPLPEEVEREMTDFAQARNVSLENYTIEKYLDEDQLVIERPIRNE